ncbi:MAG: iron-containing alcohol dehydrogenase [Spirochaetota bacterium]
MKIPAFSHVNSRSQVFSGHEALSKLPEILRFFGCRRALIITDAGVRKAGLIDLVTQPLETAGFPSCAVFDEVPADSELTTVEAAARMYLEHLCDIILAVGGGSVLDTAKAVNLVASLDDHTQGNLELRAYSGAGTVHQELGRVIAIPTTAGTGSESTLVAVIKDHETRSKLLFTSEALIPDAAFLDSRMTATLPPALTAATGMDALAHAIEAYTGLGKNPISDGLALQAIKLIKDNLLKAVTQPEDPDTRLSMAVAANLAGQSFSNSMVGLVHTIGHTVGAFCGVHHGLCMSILLPYGLEYNVHKITRLLEELAPVLSDGRTDNISAELCIEAIRLLNKNLWAATDQAHALRFHDVYDRHGNPLVKPEHLSIIAKKAVNDGSHFYSREQADYLDIKHILEASYWGYPLDRALVRHGHQ